MGASCNTLCEYTEGQNNKVPQDNQKGVQRGRGIKISHQISPDFLSNSERFKYFDKYSTTNIKDLFEFEKVIGGGHFGSVHAVHSRIDVNRKYAIKLINKNKISDRSLKRLENELTILEKLDHPNLIRHFGTFTDGKYIYIVTELCSGGEVFDRILDHVSLKERDASEIIFQCLQAVKHLHLNNICHRDLKPENIIFAETGSNKIKIIDFGLSKKFDLERECMMHSVVGTPYYVAPEVLSGEYDYRCDIWSIGVILYIVLCGYPPFNGKNSRDVIQKIKRGKLEFDYDDWKYISSEAIDLVKKLMTVDVAERITIDQALEHPWFAQLTEKYKRAKSQPIVEQFISYGSKSFSGLNTRSSLESHERLSSQLKKKKRDNVLKKDIRQFVIKNMRQKEISQLEQTFKALDKSDSGFISLRELKQTFQELKLPMEDIDRFGESMDLKQPGQLSFSEFLEASINKQQTVSKGELSYAFSYYDTDKSGFITKEDLREIYKRSGKNSPQDLERLISENCKHNEKKIDFEDFCSIFYSRESTMCYES